MIIIFTTLVFEISSRKFLKDDEDVGCCDVSERGTEYDGCRRSRYFAWVPRQWKKVN